MKKKCVFLDKMTIGNDIDLSQINELTDCTYFDTTKPADTLNRIKDAEIVITNKVVIDKNIIAQSPKLKLICVAATGYNNINIDAARDAGIIVTNVKNYSTESVAQTVFGYILNIYNSVSLNDTMVKAGEWERSEIFTMLNNPFNELRDKTLGIIGFGTIGKRVAEIAKVFGMKIMVAERPGKTYSDVYRFKFEEVLQNADILTVHTALSPETENLITEKELKLMKKSAVVINTARGGIINEHDLADALKNKIIRFAAVDVLTEEPPRNGNPLIQAPNILISPHTGWTSVEARKRLVEGIAKNIDRYINNSVQLINLCKK